jgi:hypothetical protein
VIGFVFFFPETAEHPFVQTHSIARLCDRQDKGNWCIFDDKFITCYSTCWGDFCNDDIPNPYLLPQRNIQSLGVVSGFPPLNVMPRPQHPAAPTHVHGNSVERTNGAKEKDAALDDVSRGGKTSGGGNSAGEIDYSQESKESHIIEQQVIDQPRAEKWFLKALDRNAGSKMEHSAYAVAILIVLTFL